MFALHKKNISQGLLFILIIKYLRVFSNHKKIYFSSKIKLYQFSAGSIRGYKKMKMPKSSIRIQNLKITSLKIQLSLFKWILYDYWKVICKVCISMSKRRSCKVMKKKSIFWANIRSAMLNQWIPLFRNFIATFSQEKPNLKLTSKNTREY